VHLTVSFNARVMELVPRLRIPRDRTLLELHGKVRQKVRSAALRVKLNKVIA